ncbi:hypothetical protein SISNIDRAFT_464681 [Sistotremastrum niveocremeum HHB9708]|uniref:DUF6532 domain-containing protein n=1 Tax=Sistotremastrum niveocremeum HHB9708 TaxID=1314777 RepID=A0A164X6Y6_9AGAM|nr:hypothetical protein SISNIDRAFT_464681 [Sistotremastrum niveocremeum HHB9708]
MCCFRPLEVAQDLKQYAQLGILLERTECVCQKLQVIPSEDDDDYHHRRGHHEHNDLDDIFNSSPEKPQEEPEQEEPEVSTGRLKKRTDKTQQHDKEVAVAQKRAKAKKTKQPKTTTAKAIQQARDLLASVEEDTTSSSPEESRTSHTHKNKAKTFTTPSSVVQEDNANTIDLTKTPPKKTAKEKRSAASAAYNDTLRKRVGNSTALMSPQRKERHKTPSPSKRPQKLIYRHPDNVHRNKSPFQKIRDRVRRRSSSQAPSSPSPIKRHRNADPDDSEGAHTPDPESPQSKKHKGANTARDTPRLCEYKGDTRICLGRARVHFTAIMGEQGAFFDDPEDASFVATECFDEALHFFNKTILLDDRMIQVITSKESNLRNVAKTICKGGFASTFGLGSAPKDVEKNKEIMAKLEVKHGYLWEEAPTPGVPGSGKNLYRNPLISTIISKVFFSGQKRNVIAAVFPMMFHPVPIPAIALACTVMENCMDEWGDGGTCTDLHFKGDQYKSKYFKHIKRLQDFSASSPVRRQRLKDIQMELYEAGRASAKLLNIDIVIDDPFEEADYAVDDPVP